MLNGGCKGFVKYKKCFLCSFYNFLTLVWIKLLFLRRIKHITNPLFRVSNDTGYNRL